MSRTARKEDILSTKVFLETDEYDIFMFPVPENVIKGKKFLCTLFPRKSVKQWVLSWMEKLHPCFDGRFMSDIRFYREKRQVMALVTVAEKMQVAQHLVKKRTAVFVQRPYKRRVFATRFPVIRLLVAPALSFAVGLAVLSGFTGGSILKTKADEESARGEELCMSVDLSEETDVYEESPFAECVEELNVLEKVEVQEYFEQVCGADNLEFEEQSQLVEASPEELQLAESPEVSQAVDVSEQPQLAEDSEELQQVEDSGELQLAECSEKAQFAEDLEDFQLEACAEDFLLADSPEELLLAESPVTIEQPVISADFEVLEAYEGFAADQEPSVPALAEPPFLDDFLSLLFEVGGHVSKFTWYTSPAASAVIALEGCFPEDIYRCVETLCTDAACECDFAEEAVFPLLSFSSISYRNNVPSFSLTVDYSDFELAGYGVVQESEVLHNSLASSVLNPVTSGILSVKSREPIQAPFRRLIVETGGNVTAEGVVPAFISGVIPDELWKCFSEKIVCHFNGEITCGIESVSFDVSGADSVFVRAEFDGNKPCFFPLEKISAIFPLKKEEEALLVQECAPSPKTIPAPDAVEIGSVCMDNGMYVSFYRGLDGTIIRGEPYEK